MKTKIAVMTMAAAMALMSLAPALASHADIGGTHPNSLNHFCNTAVDGDQTNHYSYATGGVVVKSTIAGTTRNTGASGTQIHDECQDDNPLYGGDNDYEWGINGVFLWTADHHAADPLNAENPHPDGVLTHINGTAHHSVAADLANQPCTVVTGPPPTFTCTYGTQGSPVNVASLTTGVAAAFTVGADVNGNGVVSSGYPQLEPTAVGMAPDTGAATTATPRQSCAFNPATIGTTNVVVCGPVTSPGGANGGEGPGYDDGSTDIDRNPQQESSPGCLPDAGSVSAADDCARGNPRGLEHGWWVFIRSTVEVVDDPVAVNPASALKVRIWG